MPEDDPKVVLEPEKADDSQEKVDVTPAVKVSEEDQLIAKVKADFEQLYGGRVKQLEDGFKAIGRLNTKLQQENETLKSQVGQLQKPPVKADVSDPWAGIENGQVWKSEIEKVAEQKAAEKLTAWQAEQRSQQFSQQQQQVWLKSRDKVEAKYPDLHHDTGNPDSVVSKTFVEVMQQHPDWYVQGAEGVTWINPYGPLLAMQEMEERLTSDAAKTNGAARSRTATASLPPSRQALGGERLTLTREQKAFCDRHNIKYEEFLKNAAALEQGAVEA